MIFIQLLKECMEGNLLVTASVKLVTLVQTPQKEMC